jgi:hypothetical protein
MLLQIIKYWRGNCLIQIKCNNRLDNFELHLIKHRNIEENDTMTALAIIDLNTSKELDTTAMAKLIGGFSHGYGVYDHYDQGSWKLIYRNSFRTRLAKNGKLYHAIQYQYA